MDDPPRHSKCQKLIAVLILFFINLLNYADRYTIAGVLTDIQRFYKIDNGDGGLLQTVFIVSFMLFSPIFGYLGDRYTRKWIMVVGILVWVLAVFASTFVAKEYFWLFLLLRGVVGIGEASYAVVSPTIIGDMYVGKARSWMLMLFYMAIPFGSGIGYMVGSQLARQLGGWQWGMRLTPLFGVASVILIVLFVFEPERGLNESSNSTRKEDMKNASLKVKIKTYFCDLWALMKNYTYIFSTIAYTCIVFVTGTLSWWVPTAIQHAKAHEMKLNSTSLLDEKDKGNIAIYFGIVTIAGGIVGVIMGSALSTLLRSGKLCFKCCQTKRSDPIICALGALIATPFLFGGLHLIKVSVEASYAFMFVAITGLCFNWAINVDLQMTIIVPWRRNSANAWQILISHLFGDASGPYLVGLLSDRMRLSDSPGDSFDALLYAFYIPSALCGVSALFFIIAATTVLRDQAIFRVEIGIHDGISPKKDVETKGNANNNYELEEAAYENKGFKASEI
ncbi:unnamed protein product, partial [Mesorhabditis belari]|uniref:Major facilitator superfamily (MFS) profile domain-containing protein n=1 Tax=Mesorhabditis belari TaxID=2138241 RepID=A0AAF3ELG7_9BILA